jgi:phosphomannomutase
MRSGRESLRIVYTPLHGVGGRIAARAMTDAGFAPLLVVGEQALPDPRFPTVEFPNPDEPGALDRALALGAREHADLVLAHDPDADRLAVAARNEDGELAQLTGNQVGVLLGHYLLTEDARRDARAVVSTIVSSPMLSAIARDLGVTFAETLTGFKWIVSRGLELEGEGKRFVLGYEEAIGYAIGPLVRDKDGIGAGVVVAELASLEHDRGRTLFDRLGDLYRRYGLYASRQRSIAAPGADGLERVAAYMTDLRARTPPSFGGRRVVACRDYLHDIARADDGSTCPLGLPRADALAYDLEGETRLVIRPSGTEPKLKYYVDHREPMGASGSLRTTEARAEQAIAQVLDDATSFWR